MRLFVARRPKRRGLLIAKGLGTKASPMMLFPLDGVDRSELDELIRAILAKQGVTEEAEIQAVVEKAEQDAEVRIKIAEVKAEVRRLMAIRAKGGKIMQRGWRKWVQVFYPAIKQVSK